MDNQWNNGNCNCNCNSSGTMNMQRMRGCSGRARMACQQGCMRNGRMEDRNYTRRPERECCMNCGREKHCDCMNHRENMENKHCDCMNHKENMENKHCDCDKETKKMCHQEKDKMRQSEKEHKCHCDMEKKENRKEGERDDKCSCEGDKKIEDPVYKNMPVDCMQIGIGYVPWQKFENLLEMDQALKHGTLFKDLVMPYTGRCMGYEGRGRR